MAIQITVQPISRTVYLGDTVYITVDATETTGAPLSFNWIRDGVTVGTGKSHNANTRTQGIFYYYCEIRSPYEFVSSNIATLTVNDIVKPVILTQPQSFEEYIGSDHTVSFTVDEKAAFSYKYEWYKDGALVATTSDPEYTYRVTSETATAYCVVTASRPSGYGKSTTSNTFTITGKPREVEIVIEPSSKTVPIGYGPEGTVEVLCSAFPVVITDDVHFEWYGSYNGGAWQRLPSVESAVEHMSACEVSTENSGTWKVYCNIYALDGETGQGSLAAKTDTVTVEVQMPDTPVFITQPQSANYLWKAGASFGTPLTAEATVSAGYITYQWYESNGGPSYTPISGATSKTYSPPISELGTKKYVCRATNTYASGDSSSAMSSAATITVSELQPPTFTKQPSDVTMYKGGYDATISATAVSDMGLVSYKLQVSNDGSSWSDYSTWQDNMAITLPAGQAGIKYYRVVAHTRYNDDGTWIYSDNAYSRTATVTVADTPTPTVISEHVEDATYYSKSANPDSLYVTCSVPAGTLSYTWYKDGSIFATGTNSIKPNVTVTGSHQYYCVVTNTLNGFTKTYTTQTAVITVYNVTVTITQHPSSATYIRGQSASSLHCTATDSAGYPITYSWREATKGVVGTGSSLSISTAETGTFKYSCVATDSVGVSATSNTATITVNPTPSASLTSAADIKSAEYYQGQTAKTLNADATVSSGTLTWQWYKNGSKIAGATSKTYTPSTLTVGTDEYYCIITNTMYGYTSQYRTNTAQILVKEYEDIEFSQNPVGYECYVNDTPTVLRAQVSPSLPGVTYQWQSSNNGTTFTNIPGAVGSTYSPQTSVAGNTWYRCVATNGTGTYGKTATSTSAKVTVNIPEITVTKEPEDSYYGLGQTARALSAEAECTGCTITYQWQVSPDGNEGWSNIQGATGNTYKFSTQTAFDRWYRCVFTAENNGYTRTKAGNKAHVVISVANPPIFVKPLKDATYDSHIVPEALDGRATVSDKETVEYQWYFSEDNEHFYPITGATQSSYSPSTQIEGTRYYYVIATARLGISTATRQSNTATITIRSLIYSAAVSWQQYLASLKTNFTKLAKLEFLQPDGSVAFTIDNNPNNRRSGAFIQSGTLTVNLQNGQRRTASITLANLDGEYDYNVNKVWFGQQIRLSEGLVLKNGQEFYLPQGVFYVKDPVETVKPGERSVKYSLVDKWSYLDGTLFGNLDGIYEVQNGQNIFEVINSLLALERGNGQVIDNVPAMYTDYYNDQTTELPDGTIVNDTDMPYTYRNDSENGTYADIILEMNKILAGWIGYDARGRLRLDPSQDDILDGSKPVEWEFKPTETQFLGATYTVKNSEVYNDVIITGEALSEYGYVAGRAQNLDPKSDTNVNLIGKKTFRESNSGYSSRKQCENLAVFYLKRKTVLQKSVTITSTQIFHLQENQLVTIQRPDKIGRPIERHLVTGFTRPIGQTGTMEIQATSVNDLGNATIVPLPGEEEE